MNDPMPQAYNAPSSEEVMTKLKEFISSNPKLQESPHPVSYLIGWCMSKYGGKLNPIKLRSMIIVAFYGKDAARFILSNAKEELRSLLEYSNESEVSDVVTYAADYLDDWISNN